MNYVMISLMLKNDLSAPLIPGCFVGLADRSGAQRNDIVVADVPIDFQVQGHQSFAISLAAYVLQQATGEIPVALQVFGPNQLPISEPFVIKVSK